MKGSKQKIALRKVREFLKRTDGSDSDTDSSSSQHSEEYSHVPLRTDIPIVDTLSLETNEMEVEILKNQVATLQQMVENLQFQQSNNLSLGPNVSSKFEALRKIPDPIKSIPYFDENKKAVASMVRYRRKHACELSWDRFRTANAYLYNCCVQ